ncbi:MAG: polyketide cyclase [Chloroflexi bacterium]|jgi:uncharacterized protein YndB with AHSA1/START domain|nr:polyketide cyclase [Chloroflexota bacterium]
MAAPTSESTTSAERELLLTRTLDAPRALVFRAWTDPEHLARWWGPRGFTTPSCTMDVRPGGAWRICMRGPDGVDHWVQGVYREVVEPERLVTTWAWEQADGSSGGETLLTVTLEERDGRTVLTLHQALFGDAVERENHQDGWSQALDRLAADVVEARA